LAARRVIASLMGAVVVVLGLCTTAGAAAPPPAHFVGGSSTGKHVFVIGDSITDLTAPDLTRSLKRYSYVIDATVGITMASSLPIIQHAVATTPKQYWVIELGTNDYNNPNAEQAFTNEINTVSGQSCVVLVTGSPLLGKIESTLDARMWALAASDRTFHVLDWGTIEFRNPKWLSNDVVHPTVKGQAKLASLERWTLKADCRH
jgi:hypothetical protein